MLCGVATRLAAKHPYPTPLSVYHHGLCIITLFLPEANPTADHHENYFFSLHPAPSLGCPSDTTYQPKKRKRGAYQFPSPSRERPGPDPGRGRSRHPVVQEAPPAACAGLYRSRIFGLSPHALHDERRR